MLPQERTPGSGSMVSKAKQGEAEHSNTMDVDAKLSVAGGERWRTTWNFSQSKKENQNLVVLVVARHKTAQFNP